MSLPSPVIIEMVERADGFPPPGRYVEHFDPDYDDGAGKVWTTEDPMKAMCFESSVEAMELWRAQSKVQPLRRDFRPNRPMTAWTVRIVSLEEALTA